MTARALLLNGNAIEPGQRATLELPVANLYTHTTLKLPVHVVRGRAEGPRLFVSAAIHGDELTAVCYFRSVT